MTLDLLRSHTYDLVTTFVDPTGHPRPGLWMLLAVQTRPVRMQAADGSGHRKVSGSPAPWADDVASWLTDVAAGARSIEESLRWAAHGTTSDRGGSDANTIQALREIPTLAVTLKAMHPADPTPNRLLADAERRLAGWVRQARYLLGVDQRWARVPLPCPVIDDDGNPCGVDGLRQDPRTGDVRCYGCGARWRHDELNWLGRLAAGA